MKWQLHTLGNLLKESKIPSSNPDPSRRIRVKLNVGGIEKRPEVNDSGGATKYFLRKSGQFIYGRQNLDKGAFGVIPEELDGFESSADIPAFDVDPICLPEWILYFFKKGNFYRSLSHLSKGVGSKRISFDKIQHLKISVPPVEEQKKVIEFVKRAEQAHQKLESEIAYQFALINQLKSNLVNQAVTGQLTADWRNQNLNEIVSPKTILNDSKQSKEKDFKSIASRSQLKTLEPFFEIPQTWKWCILDDLMEITSGVTKGKVYKEELITVPYLRVANVQRGYLQLNEIKTISVPKSEFIKYKLQQDDLLLAEGGDADKVGRAAHWNDEIKDCIHQNHIFKARRYSNYVSVHFVLMYINSKSVCQYYEMSAKQTTNLASINKSVVRSTPVALPPYEEQLKMVELVEEANLTYDALLQQIQQIHENSSLLLNKSTQDAFGDIDQESILKNFEHVQPQEYKSLKSGDLALTIPNEPMMEIIDILKKYGKTAAFDLWKLSIYKHSIDSFYAEIKMLMEVTKEIKESEKGFFELI